MTVIEVFLNKDKQPWTKDLQPNEYYTLYSRRGKGLIMESVMTEHGPVYRSPLFKEKWMAHAHRDKHHLGSDIIRCTIKATKLERVTRRK